MSFPRYPAYKDSGVEWLGEVPTKWSIAPLKRLLEFQNGADYKNVESDDGYPVYGSGGAFAHATAYMFDGESVLFGRKGTVDRPLYVTGKFWTVDTMYWTNVKQDAYVKFCYYAASTIPFGRYVTNTALPSMTQGVLGAHLIAFPEKKEQVAIAAFLDGETGKVDALVAEQERLVALLKEKRQALISHAVTKGLDPNVPMKDSGIEWLGDVPAHWDVVTLRRVVLGFEQGWSPECEARLAEDDEWGVLKAGCVNGGQFHPEEHKALPVTLKPRSELEVHNGDVLMSRASGSPQLIGSVACAEHPPARLMLSDKIFRLRLASDIRPRFFVLAMGSTPLRAQIEQAIGGAEGLASNLPQARVKDFWFAVPSAHEQREIESHIEQALGRFDELEQQTQRSINMLKERRSALISAAVTGKIDVRSVQAHEH